MNSVLSELYNGEIFPEEQYRPIMDEYKEIQKKHLSHYDDFIEKLDKPLSEEFIKIMDEHLDTMNYELSQMFIDGFRLGALVLIEVFEDKSQNKVKKIY